MTPKSIVDLLTEAELLPRYAAGAALALLRVAMSPAVAADLDELEHDTEPPEAP